MKVEVRISKNEWRIGEAQIIGGKAHIILPHPYGKRIFETWRQHEKNRDTGDVQVLRGNEKYIRRDKKPGMGTLDELARIGSCKTKRPG